MKSQKRQAMKTSKAEARKRHGKPGAGKSKYALKHKEQAKGYFSDTSPFRFGKEITEKPNSGATDTGMKVDYPAV